MLSVDVDESELIKKLFLFFLVDYEEDEYDSADSITSDIDEDEDDDVFADPLNNDPKASQASAAVKKHRRENTEHSNPYSFSWLIMRTAILRIAQNQLQDIIAVAGIEMLGKPSSLPPFTLVTCSPK